MSIEIYYRYCKLDKKHEYGVVAPFNGSTVYLNYWTYWLWYYMGFFTKGKHRKPTIIPFANAWDENSKLIKTYTELMDAEVCAKRVVNFIHKHYSNRKNENT
jgi:hypothetical protein